MTDLRASARTTAASERLFAAAQRVLPGGVNSPVRAFRSVGGTPRFIARGEGRGWRMPTATATWTWCSPGAR